MSQNITLLPKTRQGIFNLGESFLAKESSFRFTAQRTHSTSIAERQLYGFSLLESGPRLRGIQYVLCSHSRHYDSYLL